jgi:dimethylargininase
MPVAVTRRPAPTLAECELTFLDRTPIAFKRVQAQHAAYRALLASLGLEVLTLPAVDAFPDSVFVEDVGVALDEVVLLTRPGAASRQAEVALIEPALSAYQPVLSLPADGAATLEGGDVLRVGRALYAGLSSRTNAAGVEALRITASAYGYAVVPVPVTGCLHLKTGVTALDDQTLLANPAWVDLEPFSGFEIIPVHPAEAWAANVLRVGADLLVNAAWPRTLESIAQRGYAPVPVDISEFGKAEAGLTCLSLILWP